MKRLLEITFVHPDGSTMRIHIVTTFTIKVFNITNYPNNYIIIKVFQRNMQLGIMHKLCARISEDTWQK